MLMQIVDLILLIVAFGGKYRRYVSSSEVVVNARFDVIANR